MLVGAEAASLSLSLCFEYSAFICFPFVPKGVLISAKCNHSAAWASAEQILGGTKRHQFLLLIVAVEKVRDLAELCASLRLKYIPCLICELVVVVPVSVFYY